MAHDLRAKSTQCWSNCELMTNDQWSLAIRNWNAIVNPCSETELEVHKWLSLGLKLLTTNKRQANFSQRQQHFGPRRIISFLTVILKNYNVCMRRALPVCVHQEIWTQRLCRSRIYQGIQTFRVCLLLFCRLFDEGTIFFLESTKMHLRTLPIPALCGSRTLRIK